MEDVKRQKAKVQFGMCELYYFLLSKEHYSCLIKLKKSLSKKKTYLLIDDKIKSDLF